MSTAISQIEGSEKQGVELAISLGDFSNDQDPAELATYSTEGADVAAQLNSGTIITGRKIIRLRGNHDSGDKNIQWWNVFGRNYEGHPKYPYLPGETDDYRAILTGNILWLFLDDVNDGDQPWGRSGGVGGFPAGTTSLTAFNWWRSMIESNRDKIIITCAHHGLKETTIATGLGEGVAGGFHGSSGGTSGTAYLYNLIVDRATNQYEVDQSRFSNFLSSNPGAVSYWFAAHTHYDVNETYNGRTYYASKYGCMFVNVGGLTAHHAAGHPQSKIVSFVEGSNLSYVQNYLHDSSFRSPGYYGDPIEVTLPYAYRP